MTYYVPEYKPEEMVENSFQLAPPRKFNVSKVKPHVEKELELFSHSEYFPQNAAANVTAMCNHIRDELKSFNYLRYRYVVSGKTIFPNGG